MFNRTCVDRIDSFDARYGARWTFCILLLLIVILLIFINFCHHIAFDFHRKLLTFTTVINFYYYTSFINSYRHTAEYPGKMGNYNIPVFLRKTYEDVYFVQKNKEYQVVHRTQYYCTMFANYRNVRNTNLITSREETEKEREQTVRYWK